MWDVAMAGLNAFAAYNDAVAKAQFAGIQSRLSEALAGSANITRAAANRASVARTAAAIAGKSVEQQQVMRIAGQRASAALAQIQTEQRALAARGFDAEIQHAAEQGRVAAISAISGMSPTAAAVGEVAAAVRRERVADSFAAAGAQAVSAAELNVGMMLEQMLRGDTGIVLPNLDFGRTVAQEQRAPNAYALAAMKFLKRYKPTGRVPKAGPSNQAGMLDYGTFSSTPKDFG